MEQVQWADRGQLLQVETPDGSVQGGCVGVSRLGSVQVSGGFSIWVQLHGSSWVEAKEGKFRLRSGDWIAFEKDSKPTVQADRFGACMGLTLSSDAMREMTRFSDRTLYAGRGHVGRHEARIALRLWREAAARLAEYPNSGFDTAAMRPILLHLAGVQRELAARIPRCPGRSRSRKRQVFGRLQRARLYLEGNCDRVVRISELAELTSFSSWYFSKTFHSLYEESPQAASARMRLEHAADLLTHTSMMIGEVAAASGFDNCCSFARAFRARFGVSATRYRSAAASSKADSAKQLAASRTIERTGT
ncbi:helix-turn-helix domain-containing protein [Lysobacter panacisoli]|uniref:Helix-turn-helix domain-containing protein n=1 Tax=Lysobacter panacisoli TaxID=1255263 RepID=A0ABP9LR86_9GAMM|nr:helix-turn-helix domain-containing protein [Lysobacter panacisoli]